MFSLPRVEWKIANLCAVEFDEGLCVVNIRILNLRHDPWPVGHY